MSRVNRESFGPGPWDEEELDRFDFFTTAGYPALLLRTELGIWCGYVGVAPGHPAYGQPLEAAIIRALQVHGGVTFADHGSGDIRVLSNPPESVWYIGFDAAHGFDRIPVFGRLTSSNEYRDALYMQAECESLGMQLLALHLEAFVSTSRGAEA